jgi:hypothetical protein
MSAKNVLTEEDIALIPHAPRGIPKGITNPQRFESSITRRKIVEEVNTRLIPLLKAKFDLALGHYEVRENKEGELCDVYFVKPDGNAIQYLLNQTVGKPKETVEIDGDMTLKIDI